MALLYGRAGRLTAKNGGFRPGQWWWSARARWSTSTGRIKCVWREARVHSGCIPGSFRTASICCYFFECAMLMRYLQMTLPHGQVHSTSSTTTGTRRRRFCEKESGDQMKVWFRAGNIVGGVIHLPSIPRWPVCIGPLLTFSFRCIVLGTAAVGAKHLRVHQFANGFFFSQQTIVAEHVGHGACTPGCPRRGTSPRRAARASAAPPTWRPCPQCSFTLP